MVLVLVTLVATGCGGSRAVEHPVPSLGLPPDMTTPVQAGFSGAETFCTRPPLSGTIHYASSSGEVSMDLQVHGLPARTSVVINWLNDTVRGYVIGTFTTDGGGASIPASLHLFRPGEERGYKVILTTAAIDPRTLGVLVPCGSA